MKSREPGAGGVPRISGNLKLSTPLSLFFRAQIRSSTVPRLLYAIMFVLYSPPRRFPTPSILPRLPSRPRKVKFPRISSSRRQKPLISRRRPNPNPHRLSHRARTHRSASHRALLLSPPDCLQSPTYHNKPDLSNPSTSGQNYRLRSVSSSVHIGLSRIHPGLVHQHLPPSFRGPPTSLSAHVSCVMTPPLTL